MAIKLPALTIYDFFKDIKGVEIVELETLTIPKTLKGCPYDVSKVTVRRVKTGAKLDLQTEVETNQAAEGHMPNYSLAPRAWGTRIKNTPFVKHNDEVYLCCLVESNVEVYYLDNATGSTIPLVDITPWLKKTPEPKKQAGLAKKAIYRNYNLNSIITAKLIDNSVSAVI
jgi:hypothetical protein